MIRVRIPVRLAKIFGSLRCVLRGHRYGGLLMEDGAIYARCVECGQRTTEIVRVYMPLKGGR